MQTLWVAVPYPSDIVSESSGYLKELRSIAEKTAKVTVADRFDIRREDRDYIVVREMKAETRPYAKWLEIGVDLGATWTGGFERMQVYRFEYEYDIPPVVLHGSMVISPDGSGRLG